MNLIDQPGALIVFVAIVVIVSCLLVVGRPRRSILSITALSAVLSSILYAVYYSFAYGVPAFLLIGLVVAFLYYLPIALVASIVCRIVQRRKLNVFRNDLSIAQKDGDE